MTTRLTATMSLPAPSDRVWQMLGDPSYLAAKCAAGGNGTFDVASPDGGLQVTVTRSLQIEVPALARGFLGDDIRLVERHTWPALDGGPRTGGLDIEIAGAPAKVQGQMVLRADGNGSAIDLELEISVSIPLFGGSAEAMIRDALAEAIADEEGIAQSWLTA